MHLVNGLFTFHPAFIYRVSFKIGARFINGGTAQFVLRDASTLLAVPGSTVYITYNS